MKTQIGIAEGANFEDKTLTFEMEGEFYASAGRFAIMPSDSYFSLRANLSQCFDELSKSAEFAHIKDTLNTCLNLLE